jgi:hypothetical protein
VQRAVPLLLVVAALAAGCASGDADERVARPEEPAEATPPPSRSSAPRCLAGTARSYARQGMAAVARRSMSAYRSPAGRLLARFGRINVNGVPTTFRVLAAKLGSDCRPAWYRVQLPIRPNGAVGYVRASSLELEQVDLRIEVDLSRRQLTLFRSGRRVRGATVAVGSSATPTPIGRYYVNQRLVPLDKSGPYGPGAIGISAFSPVLTGWVQGGPVAIHGTNEPWSIGRAVSNGCIRLPNETLSRLFAIVPAGTQVIIHP